MVKNITILTLFPNVFVEYFNSSIIKNSINKNLVKINVVNFRDFSSDKNKSVDDTPYGGGPGMVLKLQPIVDAINNYKNDNTVVILLTPCGQTYNQSMANKLKIENDLIIICGHYEGFDQRIENFIDYSISIGDYILTGGELAAMVVVDSIVRLYEGSLNFESLKSESFNNNLLDYDCYTKPYNYNNLVVPDVLLSGNHKLIHEFRLKNQIEKTKKLRFDLYKKYIDNKEK